MEGERLQSVRRVPHGEEKFSPEGRVEGSEVFDEGPGAPLRMIPLTWSQKAVMALAVVAVLGMVVVLVAGIGLVFIVLAAVIAISVLVLMVKMWWAQLRRRVGLWWRGR